MKGKYLTLLGTALTLALSSNVAMAQSTKFPELQKENKEETTPSAERELPPDVMEILCKNFPLNSRCPGGSTASTPSVTPRTPDASPRPESIEIPTNPPEGTPNPGSETPSTPPGANETPNPTNLEQRPLITPDSTPPSGTTDSPSGGSTTPGNTPAEPTPSNPRNLTPSNPGGVNNDSTKPETKIEVPGTRTPENAPSAPGADQLQSPESSTPEQPSSPSNPGGVNNNSTQPETKIEVPGNNPINESQPSTPSTPGADQLQLPGSSTPGQPSSPSGM
ncbi:hypothetical protein [Calothrix sp. NIES-3974]|uniref:hypothetical protein n=1 Tax=Calothrix sp. NIES-3974 TaxID=2005462 RepID=UPI000B6190F4|nr:hypothetical protein [Calothrix sp. NIES-3974]BAZ05555.1 hypothetical protein NIES3974_22040 [Calothrix sp. NIES-3974]